VLFGGLGSLRARKVRAALSALGIAVGIAAGVAVLGISASAKADLLAQLGAEANLLTVSAGQSFDGSPAPLPGTAEPMIAAIPPVQSVAAVAYVSVATVRRTAAIPPISTGGISVLATQPGLLATVHGEVAGGVFSTRPPRGTRQSYLARLPPGPWASTGSRQAPRSTSAAGTSRGSASLTRSRSRRRSTRRP
jgi:hypothetical protein